MPPLGKPGKSAKERAEEAQLRLWLDQFGPALRSHFRKRGAGADAEDLVQEVFLRLQVAASRSSIDKIERYVFRIANNVLVSRYRRDQVEGRPFRDTLADDVEAFEYLSPERIFLGQEYWARFVACVGALPPRSQEAFLLHRFEDMTYSAIAAHMGISVSAVEKLICRALEQLSIQLERT